MQVARRCHRVASLAPLLLSAAVLAGAWGVVHASTSTPGPTAAFQFQHGRGYTAGSEFATATYPSASGPGPTVTLTLHGIPNVWVAVYDAIEFSVANPPSRDANLSGLTVAVPPGLPSGVACAFAFLSTAIPSPGGPRVAGAPAGCDATIPALGKMAGGCAGGSAVSAVVDLVTGVVSGADSLACDVPTGSPAGTIVLYLSYEFLTTSAVESGPLSAISLSVSA